MIWVYFMWLDLVDSYSDSVLYSGVYNMAQRIAGNPEKY